MILLGLALLAQTATLEADPYRAAITCGAAAGHAPELKGLERLAVGTHFALLAGRHSASAAPLLDTYPTEAPAIRARYPKVSGTAADLLPQCRQRFPVAWVSAPVTLPAETFPRKLLCATAIGLFMGVFDTTNGSAEDRAWFDRLARRFRPMVTNAELHANGIRSDLEMRVAMSAVLNASLDQGNVLGVTRACDAAFQG